MKIIVKAKPNAKETSVRKINQPTLGLSDREERDVYEVRVKESPVDGKANTAIARALAKHFGIAPSLVRLISGQTSKRKLFDIPLP